MVERLGPHIQSADDRGLDDRLARVHPVGIDTYRYEGVEEYSRRRTRQHPPLTPVSACTASPAHHAEPGLGRRHRTGRERRGALLLDGGLEVLDVIDDHMEHLVGGPGEPDDLVHDESHVPTDRFADEPFDVAAGRLVRLHRDGHARRRRPVDQGQGLPGWPSLAVAVEDGWSAPKKKKKKKKKWFGELEGWWLLGRCLLLRAWEAGRRVDV